LPEWQNVGTKPTLDIWLAVKEQSGFNMQAMNRRVKAAARWAEVLCLTDNQSQGKPTWK